jgi:hypothetical protein
MHKIGIGFLDASSVILGRKVASEYLALATLGTVGGLTTLSMRGGSKPKANPAKELASTGSKEEEDL